MAVHNFHRRDGAGGGFANQIGSINRQSVRRRGRSIHAALERESSQCEARKRGPCVRQLCIPTLRRKSGRIGAAHRLCRKNRKGQLASRRCSIFLIELLPGRISPLVCRANPHAITRATCGNVLFPQSNCIRFWRHADWRPVLGLLPEACRLSAIHGLVIEADTQISGSKKVDPVFFCTVRK
jgi:hypothetical protein